MATFFARPLLAASASLALVFAGCAQHADATASSSTSAPAAVATPTSGETPLATESNPPGDIPDTQAFVTYDSHAGGYEIKAPEGWARSQHGASVTFADKFDGLSVEVSHTANPSQSKDATHAAIAALESAAKAGRDFAIHPLTLPGGAAVQVTFTSNSAGDSVTGKRVRLENQAVIFARGSKTATVLLWAPLGSDNVDQWKLIESSFRWL